MRAQLLLFAVTLISNAGIASREDSRSSEGLKVVSSNGFWISPGETTRLTAFRGASVVNVTWEEQIGGEETWEVLAKGSSLEFQGEYEQDPCTTVEHRIRAVEGYKKPLQFLIRTQTPTCVLKKDDGLADNAITNVIIGRGNTVIVGTENGLTLLRWPDLQAANFKSAGSKRPLQYISSLSQRDNGEIWVGSAKSYLLYPTRGFGIEIFDPSKNDPWKKQNLLATSYASFITFGTTRSGDSFPIVLTADNYALLGGSRGGLFVRNMTQNQLPGTSIYAILPLEQGLWLVGSDRGLDLYEVGSLEKASGSEWTGTGNIYEVGSRKNVRALAMDQEKTLWVGLRGDSSGSLLRIKEADWVLSQHKKYKSYRNNKMGEVIQLTPNSGKEVRDLVVDDNNNLWIATNAGLLKRSPEGALTYFDEKNGLPNASIRDLFYDAQLQYLWIATKKGLARFSLKQL